MRTRTLQAVAASLITTGTAVAAAGLHPKVPDITICAGAVLIVLSLPLIVAIQGSRAIVPADQIAAARQAGYRLGVLHAALGILDTPPDGEGDGEDDRSSYARQLRIVTTRTETGRKAQ